MSTTTPEAKEVYPSPEADEFITATEADRMAANHILKLLGFKLEKDGRWFHRAFHRRFKLDPQKPEWVVLQLQTAFGEMGYEQCKADMRAQLGIIQ